MELIFVSFRSSYKSGFYGYQDLGSMSLRRKVTIVSLLSKQKFQIIQMEVILFKSYFQVSNSLLNLIHFLLDTV